MTEFERFFEHDFKKRLSSVGKQSGALSNGTPLSGASWDRKAAFLLWDALGRPVAKAPEPHTLLDELGDDIFGDLL